jgi:hypothetical protein
LSLSTSRFAQLEPEYCPRCLARASVLQPLFRSPLKVRDLLAGTQDDSPGSASGRAPLADPDAA